MKVWDSFYCVAVCLTSLCEYLQKMDTTSEGDNFLETRSMKILGSFYVGDLGISNIGRDLQ